MSTPLPGPALGPCSAWCTGQEAAAFNSVDNVDPDLFEVVAGEASGALFEISGRQFNGVCERTVRPCAQTCGCFGRSSGLDYRWTMGGYGWGYGWGWVSDECGDRCGCEPLSVVRLAGYPVRQVTEVKIGGVVLDPAGYRLDGWRNLVRMDDPGPPVVKQVWPGCQNLALDDTEPGTFSVSYLWGVDPPQLGKDAACQLAGQLYLSINGQDCRLPTGTTKVIRQGVQVERQLLANWFDPTKATGLVHIDAFLAAYWPTRTRRRPALWSPDVQPFARRVGS